MTIARRLLILLGVPLIALLGLGGFTRLQLSGVESRTRYVAESRIVALANLGNLTRAFSGMRIQVRDYLLATNETQRIILRKDFSDNESEVANLLTYQADGLAATDLGRRLLSQFESHSQTWIRDAKEVMSLMDRGEDLAAVTLLNTTLTGTAKLINDVAKQWIAHVEGTAMQAGKEAVTSIERYRWSLLAANSTAVLFTGLLGYVTFRRIINPIRGLEESVKDIAAGNYTKEVPFTQAKDETGGLARSVAVLKKGAAAMDEQRWVKSSSAHLTGVLQAAHSLREFGEALVSGLMPLLGGGVAGFYIRDEKHGRLYSVATYGLNPGGTNDLSFAPGDGLVGQCAHEKKKVALTDLPPNYLRINSGMGSAAPTQATAWPLIAKDKLLGVLELASFKQAGSRENALLEELLPVAALSLEVLQRNLRTQDLLSQTQEQARKLEEQTEELTQSQEELLAQQRELKQQREQLRESEERSRLILESSAEGIFGTDTEGRITFVNPAACRMLGFAPEELLGQQSHATLHHHRPDGSEYPAEVCPMHAAYKAGTPSRIDNELLWRKDGVGIPVEYGATPILKNGVVIGSVITFVDITLRKEQEATTRKSQQQLRTLVDSIRSVIFMKDRDGRHLLVNAYYEQATGISGKMIIGKTDFEVMPREVAESIVATDRQVMDSGQPVTFEETVPGANGQARCFLTTKVPLVDAQGVVYGMCGIATDITDRKHAEAELQRVNFMSDSALDLTKAGYWHVPLDGSGWYNSSERAARIFGDLPTPDHRYSIDHWLAQVKAGDETIAEETAAHFQAALEGRVPVYDTIYAYKRPVDGRIVWIHALGHVVKDATGKPTDMFGVTQDITEFKLLEKELLEAKQKAEEATRMKSMFLANMSHEIRTPMNAVIGLSHLALKTHLTPKQRDYVGKIHNAGTSLLAIINDILDFSKIEAGKLDLESADFKLDEVISSVTTLTAQKAHEKGLEFLAHIAPGIPEVLQGDPLRLSQILTNFVNNAIKFTERGEIHMEITLLERMGEKVQLKFSVQDTGIGMTKEQAAKLFQPFTQADMSTTRKHGGTGLGLTICQRLVELMGGRIWLETEAGVGSTFYFTAWLGIGSSTAASNIVPERLSKLRVLVVDDNATAREILQEPLARIAARVDAAASGKEALHLIKEHDAKDPYDIVFMDWRMPGMDGLQTSRHIKGDETLTHTPHIVLVTAFGREEVREEAERLQLDGFLVKPVTKSMITDTLTNVFAHEGDGRTQATEDGQDERLRGVRILLTEDNEINQQIAIELLQGVGASVTVADNGRKAVDLLFNGPLPAPFDVVLMDVQMPEMDGYQATAKIRTEPAFAVMPIIAMTAHATIDERQRCLSAGMTDHIPKPIDPDNLFETINRHLKPRARAPHAAPAVHPPAAESEAYPLPAIAGLDTNSALGRVAGNRKLYLKLLRQFSEQEGKLIEEISKALSQRDLPLAERLSHTLKGVAGNIGAAAVHARAGALEQLIRTGAAEPPLKKALEELSEVLIPLCSSLVSALSTSEAAPAPQEKAVTTAESREAAIALAKLLAEFDPRAVDHLSAHAIALRPLFAAEGWNTLQQSIEGYDFTSAQRELEQAMKGLPPA